MRMNIVSITMLPLYFEILFELIVISNNTISGNAYFAL